MIGVTPWERVVRLWEGSQPTDWEPQHKSLLLRSTVGTACISYTESHASDVLELSFIIALRIPVLVIFVCVRAHVRAQKALCSWAIALASRVFSPWDLKNCTTTGCPVISEYVHGLFNVSRLSPQTCKHFFESIGIPFLVSWVSAVFVCLFVFNTEHTIDYGCLLSLLWGRLLSPDCHIVLTDHCHLSLTSLHPAASHNHRSAPIFDDTGTRLCPGLVLLP